MEIKMNYKKFFGIHFSKKKNNQLSSLFEKLNSFRCWENYIKEELPNGCRKDTDLFYYKTSWAAYYDWIGALPWMVSTIRKRCLYKFIFFREYFRSKMPEREQKNNIYSIHWHKYVFDGVGVPKKYHSKKRKIQSQPKIRYYTYLPYFGHMPKKEFILMNKKFRRGAIKAEGYNKQISYSELHIKNLLTRINFSVNKINAKFLIKNESIFLHNTKGYLFTDKKIEAYKNVFKNFNKKFDWKNEYFLLKNKWKTNQKYKIQKNQAISMNNDYKIKNWQYFLSLQTKKYLINCFDENLAKNVIYMNRHFFYKNLLHNEKMSKRYWTAISILRGKIRYNVA